MLLFWHADSRDFWWETVWSALFFFNIPPPSPKLRLLKSIQDLGKREVRSRIYLIGIFMIWHWHTLRLVDVQSSLSLVTCLVFIGCWPWGSLGSVVLRYVHSSILPAPTPMVPLIASYCGDSKRSLAQFLPAVSSWAIVYPYHSM